MRFLPRLLICAACASIGGWALWGEAHRVVELVGSKTGNVVLCAEMDEGEEFVLSFTHSVNRRPVYDTLRVEGDHLVVVQSKYDSFGAGMPEFSGDEGQLTWDDDGWLVWTVNRPIPSLNLFVGRTAQHRIGIKGIELLLADLVEPGASLSIQSRSCSRFEMLIRSCLK
jgi:hypothetical protein